MFIFYFSWKESLPKISAIWARSPDPQSGAAGIYTLAPVLSTVLFIQTSLVFSLIQFSRSVMSDSLQPHGLQHARLPCPSPIPGACSNPCALSLWCYSTISSSVVPFASCLQSFPASGSFPISSPHQVAKVLEFQLQHQSFQWIFRTNFLEDRVVWSPCSPRNSQESSPTPQFKSINSSALSFPYSPTLTSIHDY